MRRCRGCGARSATAPLCRFGMVGSAGAVGREDAAVVGQHWWVQVLVDMGFPPGRARQELAAHRSVEEAVEALTPPQWHPTMPGRAGLTTKGVKVTVVVLWPRAAIAAPAQLEGPQP